MDAWQTVLLAIGGNTALLVVLGVLGKSLLDKVITRETKQFEAELKAKADSAIEHLRSELKASADLAVERLRSDLQLRLLEHQVRFSKLHEKRAAALSESYAMANSILVEARKYVKIEFREHKTTSQFVLAMSAVLRLRDFLTANRLYFPKPVADSLDTLVEHFGDSLADFERKANTVGSDEQQTAYFLCYAEFKQLVDFDAPELLLVIEDAFRLLLGDNDA